jgi:hypothetical protein
MPDIGDKFHAPRCRRCQACKQAKPDVKYDHGTRLDLCNSCWFGRRPEYKTGQEVERGIDGRG